MCMRLFALVCGLLMPVLDGFRLFCDNKQIQMTDVTTPLQYAFALLLQLCIATPDCSWSWSLFHSSNTGHGKRSVSISISHAICGSLNRKFSHLT